MSKDSKAIPNNHFHGYELLLFKKFQSDPNIYGEWMSKLRRAMDTESYDIFTYIPHSLWFLVVTLDRKAEKFLNFISDHLKRVKERVLCANSLMTQYLNSHVVTEMHLDGIFKYGDDNTLPLEIFRCANVKYLSMKYNYLDHIPAAIGRMQSLETLALTNNKLQNKSLPHTLVFCKKLKVLLLDNNLLDALPGFLLKMPSLETVHRHGNHNYFKSTFMWYHTDVNERILYVPASRPYHPSVPDSLQFWASKTLISTKLDFFSDARVAPMLKDYVAKVHDQVSVCGHCHATRLKDQSGYKVITFKNPYLGNTCVPFQHWACSADCAQDIEIPARIEQISAAQMLDNKYDVYVVECEKQYSQKRCTRHRLMCSGRQHFIETEPRSSCDPCSCVIS